MLDSPFQIHEFPRSRLATVDMGRMTSRKHLMYSLLEIDVTNARREVRRLKRAGQCASFTSWMLKAIGDSVDRNRLVHAASLGRRRVVLFSDVDIGMPVERTVAGEGVPLALRIAAVNRKTVTEIEEELQDALQQTIADERDYVLNGNRVSPAMMKIFYRAPSWLRVQLLRRMFSNPFRARANAGTVAVTTVNAVGRVSGWILPMRTMHNLLVAFGSVNKKPWVVNDGIAVREILDLTVAFNHEVIDGVPARRFIDDLVRHIEVGRLD